MSDTLMMVIAIILAAILMFVVPLMTTADRNDDATQLAVQTAASNFVNEVRTKGKITQADYDNLLESLTATGNTYNMEIQVKLIDENAAKKSLQEVNKQGENMYTLESFYTIQKALEDKGVYICKEGDVVIVKVKNNSATIADQLRNFFYTVTGNDSYKISAEYSGIVTTNGK